MDESMLEVRVEGEIGAIPARTFLRVLTVSLNALGQLERAAHPAAKRPGRWLIADLRNGSTVAVLRREDAVDEEAPMHFVDGMKRLQTSPELPPYFSPALTEALAKIGAEARQKGVSGVSFVAASPLGSSEYQAITEAIVTNARASLEGVDRAIGSVTGALDVINLRRGAHKVSLYDDISRHAVRCQFPQSLFDTMRDALGQRVRALGEITRNRRGQAVSVQIDAIERLETADQPPTVDDLIGIAPWYTGERSTDDYIRWLRDE